jgi:hypothetical protein
MRLSILQMNERKFGPLSKQRICITDDFFCRFTIKHGIQSFTFKLLPMTDFTIDELMELTQMENAIMFELFASDIEDQCEPSDEIVNNLLAYSQALSIRKSRSMNHIRLVLN